MRLRVIDPPKNSADLSSPLWPITCKLPRAQVGQDYVAERVGFDIK